MEAGCGQIFEGIGRSSLPFLRKKIQGFRRKIGDV
jgi:hypothetical protein